MVKRFCEEGNHPYSSYGVSIFHSKYYQLPERASGDGLWLVHGLTLLTRAAPLGPRKGQRDSMLCKYEGRQLCFKRGKCNRVGVFLTF